LRRIGRVFPLIVILAFTCSAHAGGDIKISATVDKRELTIDENLTLTISIYSSGGGTLPQPEIPPLPDFRILTSYSTNKFSMINNQISIVEEYTYVLQPLRTGELVIDPVKLRIDGKRLKTSRITVRVKSSPRGGAPSAPSPGRRGRTAAPARRLRNAFVKTEVDRRKVYVSEQVTLTFSFYNKLPDISILHYEPPSTSGFWAEEISRDRFPVKEAVNGEMFDVQRIKTALFPTSPGRHRIGPADLRIAYETGWFSPRKVISLSSDPIEIDVMPLPEEGKPEGFSGAVGRYSIRAEVNANKVKQGEPVTLRVEIEGTGNIDAIGYPVAPELAGFKLYEPKISTEKKISGELLGGKKILEYILIPERAGRLTIGPFRFPYFDPESEGYRTAETSPLYLDVMPGEKVPTPVPYSLAGGEIDQVGEDIRFIKPDASQLENQADFLYRNPLFWGIQILPFLCVLSAAAYRHWREKTLSDVASLRRRRARKGAEGRLKSAGKLIKNGDSRGFHSEVYRALAEFIGDKLNISAAGITTGDISAKLRERGIDEESVKGLVGIMNRCDMARFAPGEPSAEEMRSLLSEASRLVERLDRSL